MLSGHFPVLDTGVLALEQVHVCVCVSHPCLNVTVVSDLYLLHRSHALDRQLPWSGASATSGAVNACMQCMWFLSCIFCRH